MTTTNPTVLVEKRDNVAIVTLNRPEARNAVNRDLWLGVGEALADAESDPDIRVIIITGAGDKSFCAGADLKAVSRGEQIVPEDPVKAAWGFAGIVTHAVSKPLIAAVNGTALGGGTEIVLACDLAIAADNASLGLPEVKMGIIAGAGGAFRIVQQVPRKIAMAMLLTGEPISAARALELNLVNAVVPAANLMERALELAARISCNAPLAVQASKRIARGIVNGEYVNERDAWNLSNAEAVAIMSSADAREGPRAFAEKRAPVWQAR
jgi:crotonobetainyl-CoA hydratase